MDRKVENFYIIPEQSEQTCDTQGIQAMLGTGKTTATRWGQKSSGGAVVCPEHHLCGRLAPESRLEACSFFKD